MRTGLEEQFDLLESERGGGEWLNKRIAVVESPYTRRDSPRTKVEIVHWDWVRLEECHQVFGDVCCMRFI
jgi:hypothetical protein